MLHGIDISDHQRILNLEVIKPQINFVIIKATEGYGWKDPSFDRFRNEARRLDIPRGYYHFARPDLWTDRNTPEKEAEWFCITLNDIQPGELLILDYEPHWNVSGNQQVEWCLGFLKAVENRLGFKPLIYLNGNQNRTMDWAPVVINGNGLWLATYPYGAPDFNNPPVTDWPFVAMWQYTSSGRLNGYNGNLDMNVFYGDKEQFKRYGFKSENQPKPPVAPITPPVSPSKPTTQKTYKVALHDSLSGIGAKFGVDWKLIYELNKDIIKNPNMIYTGQVLKIPEAGQVVLPVVADKYVVKDRDTLSGIAAKFGTTWQNLYNLNRDVIGSNPNLIFVGQTLKLR